MVDLGGYMVAPRGVCMVAPRGCVVDPGGCVVAPGGTCMVAPRGGAWLLLGGACVVAPRGCVWLLLGGMHGCSWGGMRGCSGGVRGFFDEIRSMSGRYASYWNAFLFNSFI